MGRIKKKFPLPQCLPCFFCGVDSGPMRYFLIFTVGCLVSATVAFAVWGYLTGRFGNQSSSRSLAIEADKNEGKSHE